MTDTIAAIATPSGHGGIGIVRLSGPDALRIADALLRLKNTQAPSTQKAFSVHYGWVMDGNNPVDEILMTLMRAPKSYTAQDVVEISTHGGFVVARTVLELALKHGARLAEPGEFTKRAFLNGRIDLAQAEAVLDIIKAKTESFARVSQRQLKGELSGQLETIRAELMTVYTHVEALINFPEDDVDAKSRGQLNDQLDAQAKAVNKLLQSAHNGRLLKEGIRIVLCGKPNVGKSSLLNALLKQERAIVTPIAGTTRDVLEESAQIHGVPIQLVDTAGILEPRDLIEEEAIKRSHLFIEGADLVLLVLDAGRPLEQADMDLFEKLQSRKCLIVLNKMDLPLKIETNKLPNAQQCVRVSALGRQSIDALEQAIVQAVWQGADHETHGLYISNTRHIQALKEAEALLIEALTLLQERTSWEFISQNIKDAVNALDRITGRNIDDDLLERIFSDFCIGK